MEIFVISINLNESRNHIELSPYLKCCSNTHKCKTMCNMEVIERYPYLLM